MATKTQDKPTTPPRNGAPNEDLLETRNLNKVREILFGNQSRELETRLARFEERLTREADTFRREVLGRLDRLDAALRRQAEEAATRLTAEVADREDAVQRLTRERQEELRAVERKITQLTEQLDKARRALEEQLASQGKERDEAIRHASDALGAELRGQLDELRGSKLDRVTLAGQLSELALRVNETC